MKKWFALCRLEIIRSLEWRVETLLWVILDIFPTLVFAVVWFAIFRDKPTIANFSFSQLVGYYLAIQVILAMTENHFDERWVESVRYGKIDQYFIKPMPMPSVILLQSLVRKFMAFLLFLLPFSVVVSVFSSLGYVRVGFIPLPVLLTILLFMIFTFALSFCLTFFVVLASFWIEEANSFGHFRWLVTSIFSGALAPLAFYPKWLQQISKYLPFQYATATPALLISKQQIDQEVFHDLAILVLYVVIFMFLANFFWNKAIRKYTSAGG
ncbi:MAG: hypothetical protein UU93_C0027G0004 [Candidatus Amesbacteria bacterium GW2011_GWA2_42_12]|uniref:ABC-2 type transporter n=1 Tax=Candidatus Amesbacteria bacterium GW2011_GWA2_42_12 TaxID=1618356 RepID=A0A0G1B033_9BACT|nr:MAG: hypothetical protein UU93_C0027G0004 [Candidatus Amesbacteria bacterium GW2011_GWA2_42_12]